MNMKFRVLVTEAAWNDPRDIALAVAVDNPARADAFVGEMYDRCIRLDRFPESHALISDPRKRGVRRVVHGKYLIFFRLAGSTVEVLHVLHGARDYHRLLFPEDGQ